jgi:hypothetical protein
LQLIVEGQQQQGREPLRLGEVREALPLRQI